MTKHILSAVLFIILFSFLAGILATLGMPVILSPLFGMIGAVVGLKISGYV